MPPDVREWLPDDDLAWTVLDAVGQLDLSGFRASYRPDGHGRPAYDPALMVALLLFAYCDGVSSSRQIERRCERDVAYRVVAGNQRPDHATLARFRIRHREAIADLFVQVLGLCAAAGMVRVGLVALDGTKIASSASSMQNRTREQLDAEIAEQVQALLATAEHTDAVEDADHGEDRGDEPPPQLRGRQRRLARLQEAKARLDAEAAQAQAAQDERRRAYEEKRAHGGRVGAPPRPTPPRAGRAEPRVNVTDPDSRIMKGRHGWLQGYNAQAIVGAGQLVLANQVVNDATDYRSLHPMITAARTNLDAVGVSERMRALVADSGYGGSTNLTTDCEPILLISTRSGRHKNRDKDRDKDPDEDRAANSAPTNEENSEEPFKDEALNAMRRRLRTPAGKGLFRRRAHMIEPVFGQTKNRLGYRLRQRGLDNISTEWNLITTSHNLLKYRHHLLTTAATATG